VGADTHGIGVVVSFHDRKGGGEVGESGRGSSAYAGAVDIILHVNKPGGNFKPTVRKIEALSRFEATPAELYVELTDTGYIALGTEDDVVSAALARALVDVLPETEDAAMRIENATEKDKETMEVRVVERGLLDELAAKDLKVSRSTLDLELKRWIKEGYAGQTGAGQKGSPGRYWKTANPPESFFRSKAPHPSEESISPDSGQERPTTTAPVSSPQMHCSNAPSPWEERNAPADAMELLPSMLSSDAPDAYIERMNLARDLPDGEEALV
jgi:hypothetical protein